MIDAVEFLSILSFVENFFTSLLLTLFHFIQFSVLRDGNPVARLQIFEVTKGHLDAIVKYEKLSLKLIEAFRYQTT